MKKLDIWAKRRLLRLSILRCRERRKRQLRKWIPSEQRYVTPGPKISAPNRIDVGGMDSARLIRFLRAVARTVLKDRTPVKLDLRRVEALTVSGAILLFAEIDRIVSLSALDKPITLMDPRLRRPREVLKQIGIHKATGDSCDVIPTRDDVVFWRATRGADQTGDVLGPILEFVAEAANKEHAKQVEVSGIWRGVSEAVANTIDHAYAHDRGDGHGHSASTRWWMFTQIRNNVFTAAVCDLGCGYRRTVRQTIPETFVLTVGQTFLGYNSDAFAMRLAMEYGRSGTSQTNRGKGSRDALAVLTKHGEGQLVMMSNSGFLRYECHKGNASPLDAGDIGIDIKGTIILWKLPLGEVPNANS